MKKLTMFFKSLLIAAGLLVGGVNCTWAVDVPTPVYFNDFSSTDGLTIVGSGEFITDDNARFGQIYHNDPSLTKAVRTNYLTLPSDVLSHSAKTKEMTIGFWVNKKNAETNLYYPLFSAYTQAPRTDNLSDYNTTTNENGMPMFVCQSRGLLQYNNEAQGGSGSWCNFEAAQNDKTSNAESNSWLDDGNWHYYTVTITETRAIVYIDGTVMNSWTLDNSTDGQKMTALLNNNNLTYVTLGGNQAWGWGDPDPAFGFDDFAVYDAALSAEQIEKIIDTKLGYTKVTYDFTSYGSKTLTYESDRCANANSSNFYRPTNLPEAHGRFAFAHNDAVSVSSTNGLYLQRSQGDYAAILGLAANDKVTINLISGSILWRSGSSAISVTDWTNYTAGAELKTTASGNLYFQGKNTCKISSVIIKTLTTETMTVPAISSEANGDARTVTITAGESNIKSGVTTYYTTDGSEPTSASTVYSAPFDVNETTTVKAITISNSSAETASTVTTQLIDMDQVDTPTATLTAVDGINRTITFACATDGATLYYSTDNGDNYTQGTSLVISANTAIIVKATKGSAEAVSEVYNFEAGTAITLNTPAWTKTGYSEGVSTVTLADNQSDKLLSPVSTIKYQINDGAAETYSTAISVNDGETLKYWSEATGYTNSAEGSVTAVAPCSLPNLWNETYKGVVNSDKTFTLGNEVVSTVNTTNFYYVFYDETTKLSERLISNNTPTSGSAKSMLRSNGIYAPNTMYMAILNLKVGDYVTINGAYGNSAFSVTGNTTDFKADEWNTTAGSKYCFTVKKAGTCRFNLSRQGYLQSITVQRALTTPGATVGSTGYATFAADVALDLSTLTSGFTAYFASSAADGKVNMTKATDEKIAAGEGLFIQKTGDANTFTITETREATDDVDNYLVAGDGVTGGVTKEDGYDKYVLGADGGSVSFFLVNETAATVPANKAYLKLPAGDPSARLTISFGEETTGISFRNVETTGNERFYNLQGQPVAAPTKGLYIVRSAEGRLQGKNGKKVIVK